MKLLNRNYSLAVCAYCAIIFYMSSQPGANLPRMPFLSADKLLHGVVYAALAALVSIGMRRSEAKVSPLAHALLPVVFAALYGLSDEIHQYFVPTRHCDWKDFVADALGAVVMQAILLLLRKAYPQSAW